MKEESVISFVQKGLRIKFILLSVLVFGVIFAHPAGNLLQAGAQQVCQWTMQHDQPCPIA